MALRSGYKGFKKLLPGLKIIRPGTLGIDNDELSKSFLSISDQEKLGAFQLLKPVSAFTKTNHSVEFVYDPVTQIITANGKATGGAATIQFMQRYNQEGDKQFISNGEYYLSGGINNDCYLIAGITDDGQYKQIETVGSYPKKIVIDGDDSSNDGAYLQIAIRIAEGVTVNNARFKPMLSYQPGEFTTYAMTNMELSEVKDATITGTLTGATIESTSKYKCIGKVCWAYFKIKMTDTLAAGGRINITALNLPKNMLGVPVFASPFNVPGAFAWINEDTNVIFLNDGSSIAANTEVQFSFCYPIM